MALFWKSKVLLGKVEATYGTDAAPTGGANAILATNLRMTPMQGQSVSRNLERAFFGNQGQVPVGIRARIQFRVELQGSGTAGTAPSWGPLLRACAVSETVNAGVSVVYAPVTDSQDSATIHFWVGSTKHAIVGARGNARIVCNAQELPYIEFDFMGIYATPTEAAAAVPDVSGFQAPVVATTVNTPIFTVDGNSLVMRSFALAFNNQVSPRLLVGFEGILITDKSEAITCQVEAVPVTTFNPFQYAQTPKPQFAVELEHGTDAGGTVHLSCPTTEMGLVGDYQQQDGVTEWQLPMEPLPASGNDQWSLTLT